MSELNSEALNVIEKVKKLLALAAGNANEHEAASATEKAMALLEAYNLDMSVVGKTAKGPQTRSDKKRKGGLYGWQRDLWKAVAELNFCVYWSIKGLTKGSTYEHRILGSQANVIGAEVMAEYLQQAIERLAQAEAKARGLNVFCREMIAYREGMATRVAERLQALRKAKLAEEQARNTGNGGGTGLVLLSAIHAEEDANRDYINGWEPGTSARYRSDRLAAQARAQAEAEERLAADRAWREANPDLALERDAKERAESDKWWADYLKRDAAKQRRREKTGYQGERTRAKTAAEQRAELSEFKDGYRKGEDVGLDKQVDKSTGAAITEA